VFLSKINKKIMFFQIFRRESGSAGKTPSVMVFKDIKSG
jgi:hypothetical protein